MVRNGEALLEMVMKNWISQQLDDIGFWGGNETINQKLYCKLERKPH